MHFNHTEVLHIEAVTYELSTIADSITQYSIDDLQLALTRIAAALDSLPRYIDDADLAPPCDRPCVAAPQPDEHIVLGAE
jgi:hypothetical protein